MWVKNKNKNCDTEKVNAGYMFKKLGYKIFKRHGGIIGYKKDKREYIVFHQNETYHYYRYDNGTKHTLSIVPELLKKAITKQMIELWWTNQ